MDENNQTSLEFNAIIIKYLDKIADFQYYFIKIFHDYKTASYYTILLILSVFLTSPKEVFYYILLD